ncbi:hypothetical protein COCOBI_13-4730 [Coccomyxa sp. Obi]|nr:hypothetical protein COCOBI_13-4730 [Coccomyxa sp. Obi]
MESDRLSSNVGWNERHLLGAPHRTISPYAGAAFAPPWVAWAYASVERRRFFLLPTIKGFCFEYTVHLVLHLTGGMPHQLPNFIKNVTCKFGGQMRRYAADATNSAQIPPAQMAHMKETIKGLQDLAGRVPSWPQTVTFAGLAGGATYAAINQRRGQVEKSVTDNIEVLKKELNVMKKEVNLELKAMRIDIECVLNFLKDKQAQKGGRS